MFYTIILYLRSGTDRCRGCEMSSWGSRQEVLCFDDRNKAIKFLANIYVNRQANKNNREYHFWNKITILINGKDSEFMSEEEGKEVEDILAAGEELSKELFIKYLEDENKKRLEKLQEEEKQRLLEQKQDEENERAELARLQQKYGNP